MTPRFLGLVPVDNRDIRAYLRAATRAKIISGWYGYRTANTDGEDDDRQMAWCIAPYDSPPVNYDYTGACEFTALLAASGIEPEYIGA